MTKISLRNPTFGERVKSMQALADNLTAMANMLLASAGDVADEAARMSAAEKRFAERRADKHRASR